MTGGLSGRWLQISVGNVLRERTFCLPLTVGARRLSGTKTVCDSGDHQISGVSQQSGSSSSLVFMSQSGPVALDTLRRAEGR